MPSRKFVMQWIIGRIERQSVDDADSPFPVARPRFLPLQAFKRQKLKKH
jgi:hypothetical protein